MSKDTLYLLCRPLILLIAPTHVLVALICVDSNLDRSLHGDRIMSRIRELFQKYGKTAVAVHFGVYFTTFGGAIGVQTAN